MCHNLGAHAVRQVLPCRRRSAARLETHAARWPDNLEGLSELSALNAGGSQQDGPWTLEDLASRVFGERRTIGRLQRLGWRGQLAQLPTSFACPKCEGELKPANGTGAHLAIFVFLCPTCCEVFEPADIGVSDEELPSTVDPIWDAAGDADTGPSERSLSDRYARLATAFSAQEERLATWGIRANMPEDLRTEVFTLWQTRIERLGDRSLALLQADRRELAVADVDHEKAPVREADIAQRFQCLYAAFDIEGEVLGHWGMTSAMPNDLRTSVFLLWRDRLQHADNAGRDGRSMRRLEEDQDALDALREEWGR